jgi:hypothetical protein
MDEGIGVSGGQREACQLRDRGLQENRNRGASQLNEEKPADFTVRLPVSYPEKRSRRILLMLLPASHLVPTVGR